MKHSGNNCETGDPGSASSQTYHSGPAVLTDFDDTVAVQNVAELLLQRCGHSSWQDVRQRFRDGLMTLKEYQEITFREIQADSPTMERYVKENANFRPHFRELWRYCQGNRIPMAIISQGLDFYIEALLEKEGLTGIPVYAVNTRFTPQGITYQYNHTHPGKEELGNSKGLVVDQFRQQGHYVFFAGDGSSDLEAAVRADMVFAHRTLARQCSEQNIPFREFTDFGDMFQAVRSFSQNGSKP